MGGDGVEPILDRFGDGVCSFLEGVFLESPISGVSEVQLPLQKADVRPDSVASGALPGCPFDPGLGLVEFSMCEVGPSKMVGVARMGSVAACAFAEEVQSLRPLRFRVNGDTEGAFDQGFDSIGLVLLLCLGLPEPRESSAEGREIGEHALHAPGASWIKRSSCL